MTNFPVPFALNCIDYNIIGYQSRQGCKQYCLSQNIGYSNSDYLPFYYKYHDMKSSSNNDICTNYCVDLFQPK